MLSVCERVSEREVFFLVFICMCMHACVQEGCVLCLRSLLLVLSALLACLSLTSVGTSEKICSRGAAKQQVHINISRYVQKYPSFTHIYFIAGWFRKGREALSEGSVFFKLYQFYIFFIFSSCFLVLRYFVKNCCVATLLCKKTLIVFVLHESSSSISLMHT